MISVPFEIQPNRRFDQLSRDHVIFQHIRKSIGCYPTHVIKIFIITWPKVTISTPTANSAHVIYEIAVNCGKTVVNRGEFRGKVLTLKLFYSFEFECVCFCVCLLLFPSFNVRYLAVLWSLFYLRSSDLDLSKLLTQRSILKITIFVPTNQRIVLALTEGTNFYFRTILSKMPAVIVIFWNTCMGGKVNGPDWIATVFREKILSNGKSIRSNRFVTVYFSLHDERPLSDSGPYTFQKHFVNGLYLSRNTSVKRKTWPSKCIICFCKNSFLCRTFPWIYKTGINMFARCTFNDWLIHSASVFVISGHIRLRIWN